jgi:hypothetical protein
VDECADTPNGDKVDETGCTVTNDSGGNGGSDSIIPTRLRRDISN